MFIQLSMSPKEKGSDHFAEKQKTVRQIALSAAKTAQVQAF